MQSFLKLLKFKSDMFKIRTTTYRFPSIEMHARQFRMVWFSNVNVEALTLIYKSCSIGGHFDNVLL